MNEELPALPGFREMAQRELAQRELAQRELAQRRQGLLAELVAGRHDAGLSQADVAERMGTSQPAVARLEAGGVDARLSTLERYAAAVGLRMEVRLWSNG